MRAPRAHYFRPLMPRLHAAERAIIAVSPAARADILRHFSLMPLIII